MPPDPPNCSVFMHTLQTTQTWWLRPCITVHYPFSVSPSSSSDSPSLLDLARNLLVLDIGEQLAPVLSEVESQCRERVYPAEEEYEGGRGRQRGRDGGYSLIRSIKVQMREEEGRGRKWGERSRDEERRSKQRQEAKGRWVRRLIT